uniref:NADH-ubiquinone oxidoreductase chain 3 n=1 Tax=Matsumurasca onukii TaxID=2912585 RepID=A0A343UNU4_MATON|nr:NADH dehydrogenase subunit 3 [Matsumurasca onukii]AVF91595.1 NADH dehydrogenase subunit 3 [Matsumurasca onukii]
MFFVLIFLILFIISFLILLISKKSLMDSQKSSPFECGFNPMADKRMPFSIHFFLIAVIFLVFDIEIIIILPMILTLNTTLLFFWLTSSLIFIFILCVGLYYEWLNGMLNWTKL